LPEAEPCGSKSWDLLADGGVRLLARRSRERRRSVVFDGHRRRRRAVLLRGLVLILEGLPFVPRPVSAPSSLVMITPPQW
jgi:hypothetical protein